MYQILVKGKREKDYIKELFLTGGAFYTFKKAHRIKKKLQNMCNSLIYKVNKEGENAIITS